MAKGAVSDAGEPLVLLPPRFVGARRSAAFIWFRFVGPTNAPPNIALEPAAPF